MGTILTDKEYVIEQHTVPTPYPVGPVHVYTFKVGKDLVMIDTGPPTKEAKAFLENNVDLNKLKYVLLTHCHPDHYGLSAWLHKEHGVTSILSRYDEMLYTHLNQRIAALAPIYASLGFPKVLVEAVQNTMEDFKRKIPFADEYLILEEQGELLEDLGIEYFRAPGHTQSDVIFTYGNFAFTGDVLLRDIFQTPLLDVNLNTMEGRFGNYAAYCETINKLKTIEHMTLMPGHREYVDSVKARVKFYVRKLVERANVAKPFLESGLTVFEVVQEVHKEALNDPFVFYVKTSEVVFIRDFIRNPRLLKDALLRANLYTPLRDTLYGFEFSSI